MVVALVVGAVGGVDEYARVPRARGRRTRVRGVERSIVWLWWVAGGWRGEGGDGARCEVGGIYMGVVWLVGGGVACGVWRAESGSGLAVEGLEEKKSCCAGLGWDGISVVLLRYLDFFTTIFTADEFNEQHPFEDDRHRVHKRFSYRRNPYAASNPTVPTDRPTDRPTAQNVNIKSPRGARPAHNRKAERNVLKTANHEGKSPIPQPPTPLSVATSTAVLYTALTSTD